ncbi:MAG: hypothetical protein AB1411_07490 [Nitrospirota bacterium]
MLLDAAVKPGYHTASQLAPVMMHRMILRKSLTIGLVSVLLLLAGTMYARAVAHEAHHAHHQARTHATALCAWMCTAGTGLDAHEVILAPAPRPLVALSLPFSDDPVSVTGSTSLSRAPPSLFA